MTMKRFFLCCLTLLFIANAFSQEPDNPLQFGLCGDLNFGYHSIGSDDLENRNLGEVGVSGMVMVVSAGIDAYKYQEYQVSCVYSLSWLDAHSSDDGFGFKWGNAFRSHRDIPMSLFAGDIRLEFQLLKPLISKKIFPFIGIGRTLAYRLTDNDGNGFTDGGGDFHFSAGIDVAVENGLFRSVPITKSVFSGWRIGVIYRPSFVFKNFKLDETVPVEYGGNSITIFLGFHIAGLFF
jgi:hypothetical protein